MGERENRYQKMSRVNKKNFLVGLGLGLVLVIAMFLGMPPWPFLLLMFIAVALVVLYSIREKNISWFIDFPTPEFDLDEDKLVDMKCELEDAVNEHIGMTNREVMRLDLERLKTNSYTSWDLEVLCRALLVPQLKEKRVFCVDRSVPLDNNLQIWGKMNANDQNWAVIFMAGTFFAVSASKDNQHPGNRLRFIRVYMLDSYPEAPLNEIPLFSHWQNKPSIWNIGDNPERTVLVVRYIGEARDSWHLQEMLGRQNYGLCGLDLFDVNCLVLRNPVPADPDLDAV